MHKGRRNAGCAVQGGTLRHQPIGRRGGGAHVKYRIAKHYTEMLSKMFPPMFTGHRYVLAQESVFYFTVSLQLEAL